MKTRPDIKRKLISTLLPALSALTVFSFYALICRMSHIVFFSGGAENTLAKFDAYYQYLDFLAWMKDVISGKQSIAYTFNCALGQEAVGLFSYYLASPFNVLLQFFAKTDLHVFFNLVLGFKIACCGAAMAIYLGKRFPTLSFGYIYALSVSYGMMQYNFSQGSNIMWLDGVYMLPFILLGVYRVQSNRSINTLSISIALSILFNWYTGGINCLTAAAYFLTEYFLDKAEKNEKAKIDDFCRSLLRFAAAVCIGIMISAFLFLPTIWNLIQGKGGSFDWFAFRPTFTGNLLSFIHAYSIGEISAIGHPALYCGCAVLVGCVAVFTLKTLSEREKCSYFLLLLFSLLIFYWKPFFILFSLLKNSDSYYYRYAYVSIFSLIFVSARFFMEITAVDMRQLIRWMAIFFFVILGIDYANPHATPGVFHVGLELLLAILMILYLIYRKWNLRVCSVVLLCVWFLDLLMNGYFVAQNYIDHGAERFAKYNRDQLYLIDMIQEHDADFYRISQLMTRSMNYQATTANYNESMAFNYMSVENYTSCPQNTQLEMLNKFGYPTYMDCMLAKNTFLLPVDTLLSVKYLLAPYAVRGVNQMGLRKEINGKLIYQNSYRLPFAFSSETLLNSTFLSNEGLISNNPFDYWNDAYYALSGIRTPIVEPLEFSEEVKSNKQIIYTIRLPQGNYAVYGNIPTSEYVFAKLNLNNVLTIPYSRSQAVQVFHVPSQKDQKQVVVSFEANNLNAIQDVQFYGLNLDTFGEITSHVQDKKAESIVFNRDYVVIDAKGKKGADILFTSIPYDTGWRIVRNGKIIKPELFEKCLMCLPLEDGDNHFELHYHIPLLSLGIVISVSGVLLLAGFGLFESKIRALK